MSWNDPNPYKDAARIAVRNAIRSGLLTKPKNCSECGDSGIIHGHHDNYDLPLDVIWLCPSCHKERHYSINQYGIDNVIGLESIFNKATSVAKELI